MPDTPDPASQRQSGAPDCYLAFDFGLKRIGIASGNATAGTSQPLTTVRNHNGTLDWDSIDATVTEWQPVALVVGRPLQLDGSTQVMTREADAFMKKLRKRYQLPVYAADERESSTGAEQVIRDNRRHRHSGRKRKADIDKMAAALILARWFEEQNDVVTPTDRSG